MVSYLESKGWKKVFALQTHHTKKDAEEAAYNFKRRLGGKISIRREGGVYTLYSKPTPKKTGAAAIESVKKLTSNTGWTVTHTNKQTKAKTTVKNAYKKPTKTKTKVSKINYPKKFRGQYKYVKYEYDGRNSIVFETDGTFGGGKFRNVTNQDFETSMKRGTPITKAFLVNYIKGQIDLNPKWSDIAKKAHNPVKKAAPKKAAPKKRTSTKPKAKPAKIRQSGKSNKALDAKRKAKPPGKRRSKSGKTYYESRRNRSDMPGFLI